MNLICPHCSQQLEADDSLAGATVECPKCGNAFTIPPLEPKLKVLSSRGSTPPVKPTPPKKGKRIALSIVGGLIGLLVVIGLFNFFAEQGRQQSPSEEPQDTEQEIGDLSHYLFDSAELAAYFYRDNGLLTSIQRRELEETLPKKLLQSSLHMRAFGTNMVFHPIPDGTVFSVLLVSVPKKDDAFVRISLSIVPAEDGFKMWEFRRADQVEVEPPSSKALRSYVRNDESEVQGNPDGVDWDTAPWKHQTKAWTVTMKSSCFPGMLWEPYSSLTLCLYRTPEVEKWVSEWATYFVDEKLGEKRILHIGPFLVSRGWMVGLPLGMKDLKPNYILFSSKEEVAAFACGSRSFRPRHLEIVGPREKSDVAIRDKEMGREVYEYPFWTQYPTFNLPSSVKMDKDFQRFALDEEVALEFLSYKKLQGNDLRKNFLFQSLWDHAEPYIEDDQYSVRESFVAFPDDVTFAVVDVDEKWGMYDVSLLPVAQSDEDLPVTVRGVISPEDFLWYLSRRYGISCTSTKPSHIYFPKNHQSIQHWSKGTFVKSKAWIIAVDLSVFEDSKTHKPRRSIMVKGLELYPSVSVYRQYRRLDLESRK